MRFALLGLALGLSAYLLASSLVALLVPVAFRLRAPRSASLLFGLRLLPALAGAFVALALVAPAYLKHEPRGTTEPLGRGLLLLVAGATLFVGLALRRGLRAWAVTRRLSREWRAQGLPVELPGVDLPSYVIEHRFPVVAVVGLRRPALFVARQVLERLTPAELTAVAQHEAGHISVRDNLRMTLMRCAPDWLSLTSSGERLCAAFGVAIENEADDHAARDPQQALDLASALVSVARLVPPGLRLALPVSTFHDGDELEPRVTRLLARAEGLGPVALDRPAAWGAALAAAAFVALLQTAWSPGTLEAVHEVAELGVVLLHF